MGSFRRTFLYNSYSSGNCWCHCLHRFRPQKTLRAWKVEPAEYVQAVSSLTGLHDSILMLATVELDNNIEIFISTPTIAVTPLAVRRFPSTDPK